MTNGKLLVLTALTSIGATVELPAMTNSGGLVWPWKRVIARTVVDLPAPAVPYRCRTGNCWSWVKRKAGHRKQAIPQPMTLARFSLLFMRSRWWRSSFRTLT